MWTKILSDTDAQQPTNGWPVEYLRFTKSKNPQDNLTWFRHTFFAASPWRPGFHGQHVVEEVNIPFAVSLLGVARGTRSMRVTHDSSRQANNRTPNTYLHYDAATLADLRATNYSGRTVTVQKNAAGAYIFSIN